MPVTRRILRVVIASNQPGFNFSREMFLISILLLPTIDLMQHNWAQGYDTSLSPAG